MYLIRYENTSVYDPRLETHQIREASAHLVVGEAGSLSFTVDYTHPALGTLQRMKGIVELTSDNEPIFRGRIIKSTEDLYRSHKIECEGVQAFLNDSQIPPFVYPDDFLNHSDYQTAAASGNVIAFFLGWILSQHNAQVTAEQQIQLGSVTVTDPNNYIRRSSESYLTSREVIKSRITDTLSGYLMIRYESDGNYLDFLSELPLTNTQSVEFGGNLMDYSNDADGSGIFTQIIPLGTDGLDITSLADGDVDTDLVKSGNLIYSRSGVQNYGKITRVQTWDDVTEATNLRTKAAIELRNVGILTPETITVKAVDLSCSDSMIAAFRVGRNTLVLSDPHGLNATLPLMALDLDPLAPGETSITLGATEQTLTGTIGKAQKGKDGQDGISNYTHIRYSINADGNPMVSTPTDATLYIGVYTGTNATAPTSYTDYTWSRYTGQDGTPGKDGYTVNLSAEYIEVEIGVNKKPTSSSYFDCVVSVYKGLTALAATNSTVTDGKFKVTVTNSVTGVTVTQNTAGTVRLAFSQNSEIPYSAKLTLSIAIYGGTTITRNIFISTQMQDVVISNNSEITWLDSEISLRVTQIAYSKNVPEYSATNPATSWTAAQKSANVGYLWYDTSTSKLKAWNRSAWEEVTAANASSWASYQQGQVKILSDFVGLMVEKDGVVNTIAVSTEGVIMNAERVQMYSRLHVYTGNYGDTGARFAGYIGYGQSNISGEYGILMAANPPNTGEVIATDSGARISYDGTASQVYASQTQAGMIAPGCVIECSSANTGKVIAGYSGGSLSYGNTDLTYDGYSQLTSSQKAERDANMQKVARVYAAEGISGMKSKSVEIASLYEGGVVKLKHAHTTATSPDPDGWSAYWCGGGSGAIFAPDTAYASLGVSSDGSSVDGITLYRWQNGYFKNVYNSAGAITSSDRDLKREISYDLSKYAGLLDALKPAKFKYIDGESDRTHLGLIAQDVLEEMVYQGLETTDFAGYVYNPDSGTCGIRYDEIIPLLILGYQNILRRVEEMGENHADDNSVTGNQGA